MTVPVANCSAGTGNARAFHIRQAVLYEIPCSLAQTLSFMQIKSYICLFLSIKKLAAGSPICKARGLRPTRRLRSRDIVPGVVPYGHGLRKCLLGRADRVCSEITSNFYIVWSIEMIRRNNSSYSSNVFLHKTPDARENYSQKTSSFNLDSRSFADGANKGKTPVVELRDPTLRGPAGFGFETPHSKRSSLSVASAKTRIVYGRREGGCLVSCLACVAKISYAEARKDAIKYGGFVADRGMHMEGATQVLNHWGIRNALIDKYTPEWTDFPDKAIIGVMIYGQEHAVVLRRINGKLYVYDSRQSRPVSDPEKWYDLIVPDCYIAILDAKPRTTPPSRTGYDMVGGNPFE